MIKQWYTASELADFKLDGMPHTKRGVSGKADNEEWSFRESKALGGSAKEYHVSNLKNAAYISLIEKAAGQNKLKELEDKSASLQMQKTASQKRYSEFERTTARIAIVSLFESFRNSLNLKILEAEKRFIGFYQTEGNKECSAIVPKWIFDIYPKFSVQSLRNWRSTKKKATSLEDLSAKYGNRKGTGIIDRAYGGDMATYVAALITKQSHLTVGHVRDLCINKFGLTVKIENARNGSIEERDMPSIKSFERFINRWKSENKGLFLNLTDPDGYKNSMQPAFGKADSHVQALNQVWEIDASPVDAMCDDGRYNIYSIIDIYSRRAMFSVSKTPTTEASLLLVRRAIMEWGVPDVLKTDNGSDFVSYRFRSAMALLGVEQSVCTPFTPEAKAYVERVFRTLQHDLMPLLPGFIGHSVADRSKIEKTKAFSKRLGESDKDAFSIEMTADDLQQYIDDWAFNKYGNRVHGSTKEAPNQRAQSWVGAIKKIANERVLDVLLSPIASGNGYRVVTKKGIRTDNAEFIAPELALHIGDRVFVRHNPDDLGRIYVFKDEKGEFICEAKNAHSLGISRKHATEEAKAAQREVLAEKRKEIKAIQRTIKPRDMVDAILKQDADQSENIIPFRPESTHTSPGIIEAQKALNTFEPVDRTELNDEQEKRHQELMKEMATPAKPEIHSFDSKQLRLQRAEALEDRLAKGNRISQQDKDWLDKYQTLPEYRAHQSMKVGFGEHWFEEKGD